MEKETAAQAGTRIAWRNFFDDQPYLIAEIIHNAAKEAMTEWLDRNGADLLKPRQP